MNKKIIIIVTLCSTLIGSEIWVDDIAALYYGQKMMQETSVKAKKLKQEDISKLSCFKNNEIFEIKDKNLIDDCDILFVELKRVYYTKTLFSTQKISKDKAKMPLNSFESVESLKKIHKNGTTKIFNAPFELSQRVALQNIKVGDRVSFIVTSFGRSKAGVSVTYNKKVVAISDKDGYVNIEMKKSGFQNIKASYSQKGDGIKCDEIVHSTTLTIDVLK